MDNFLFFSIDYTNNIKLSILANMDNFLYICIINTKKQKIMKLHPEISFIKHCLLFKGTLPWHYSFGVVAWLLIALIAGIIIGTTKYLLYLS